MVRSISVLIKPITSMMGICGSGKAINAAIKKYGLENFEKEILLDAASSEEMFDKEQELVELGSHSYNLKEGGKGGFDHLNARTEDAIVNRKKGRTEANRVLEEKHGPNWRTIIAQKANQASQVSEYGKIKRRESFKRGQEDGSFSFLGRKHSDESKKKMSEKAKERLKKSENNSQYGSMWITDGTHNRKIMKDDQIPKDWKRGRVIQPKHPTNI